MICRLNDSLEFHGACMPKKEGGYFINVGSQIRNELELKIGDEITANFSLDTTDFQFEFPLDFIEVLKTDLKANRIFWHVD